MTPIRAYQIYKSLNLHFTPGERFNVRKAGFVNFRKSKTSKNPIFETLARLVPVEQDLAILFANAALIESETWIPLLVYSEIKERPDLAEILKDRLTPSKINISIENQCRHFMSASSNPSFDAKSFFGVNPFSSVASVYTLNKSSTPLFLIGLTETLDIWEYLMVQSIIRTRRDVEILYRYKQFIGDFLTNECKWAVESHIHHETLKELKARIVCKDDISNQKEKNTWQHLFLS